MFGKNQIVGQKFFTNAEDKLLVTSRFITLQGEGPYAGMVAVFLRLAKCNLACSFCDTYFDDGSWMTVDEIEQDINVLIEEHFKGNVPYWMTGKRRAVFVLTGGEPMLQKNAVPLLERMAELFEHTQIESNGTVYQEIPASTTLVISPKCSEKHGVALKYLVPHAKNLERADCLKFVVSAEPDSPYSSVPEWAHEWKRNTGKTIFASPMNIYNSEPQKSKNLRASRQNDIDIQTRSNVDEVISFWEPGLLDMKANQINHEYVARYCVDHGLRLNLQIHLYASLA